MVKTRIMTIKIKIELMGSLKTPTGKRKFNFELEDGTNVRQLLKKLDYSEEDAKYLLTFINSEHVKHETILKNGDVVFITVPVGGG
ncbi:MAG: MoaD/ThiS family protein [Candidatus Odinarchaeota archaeon]